MSAPTARDLRLARAVATLTLPSGLWRIALVLGLPVMGGVRLHALERVQIVSLSLVAEVAALTCLALVRPWGEVVPTWVPRWGGRSIPAAVVVVPAGTGALLLTVLWTTAFARAPFVGFFDYFPSWQAKVLVSACYLPLLAWGPLLAVLTVRYRRRHSGTVPEPCDHAVVAASDSREQ